MTESTKARTAGPPIPESQSPDRDYPQMVGERGLIEPAPRRVRGYSDGTLVFDTTRAHYVWEIAYYPQYYVPLADVRPDVLVPEGYRQHSPRGDIVLHGLKVGDAARPHAAKVLADSPIDGLSATARFEWAALDAWYEEDEQVFVHPRNPYVRVDALRSTRPSRLSAAGCATSWWRWA